MLRAFTTKQARGFVEQLNLNNGGMIELDFMKHRVY